MVDIGIADDVITVRDVVLHVIEETARHAGHLDVARELIDGRPARFDSDLAARALSTGCSAVGSPSPASCSESGSAGSSTGSCCTRSCSGTTCSPTTAAPTLPATTVRSLEDNTFWDGLFHLSTWVFVTVGLFLLWRVLSAGYQATWRSMVGLLLAGWGIFNLVEGIVDHHLLTIHHVRDDVADPLWWDIGFLAFGAVLVVAGLALRRT